MKVLHICNDFSYSKVHTNLYKRLDELGVAQIIFHPLRSNTQKDINTFSFQTANSGVFYSKLLKKNHRILFRKKINFLFHELLRQTELGEINIQHATTLFSDGAIAYKIFKKYKIPYFVTVRNTDANTFLKYRPDLYRLAESILDNASQIIFISPSIEHIFFSNPYFKKKVNKYISKITKISNGIDDFWLDNKKINFNRNSGLKFLFIGRFDKNKNCLQLIKALSILKNKYRNLELNLVGGHGAEHSAILNIVEKEKWIHYFGEIYDKEELLSIFKNSDFFCMISKYETFGLVYVEALSQGLPILYTKNQGIDGVFNKSVGVSSTPDKLNEIVNALEQIIRNREDYVKNISLIDFKVFDWNFISKNYKMLYEKYSK